MTNCPCGSKKQYENCCEPYIKGNKVPETAEELMRSRYSAYVVGEVDYILQTNHPDTREGMDREAIKAWSDKSDWQSLNIIETEAGLADDIQGIVEFQAVYKIDNVPQIHHERSIFDKIDGRWYYTNMIKIDRDKKEKLKVGRNSPCPCGSGKKYKKCCG